MQTSSVCDPSRPAALSPLICRPNGITLFGAATAAAGALTGALLFGGNGAARFAGVLGLLATGTFVAASSPEATGWFQQTKSDVQHKFADRREQRAQSRAATAAARPVAVAIPVEPPEPHSISRPVPAPAVGSASQFVG